MRLINLSLGIFIICFSFQTAPAQKDTGIPQGISYQAIARDATGKEITNREITLRISILEKGFNGLPLYSEIHRIRTDDFGLFTLIIGQGETIAGEFSSIKWQSGNLWFRIELAMENSDKFRLLSTSRFLSVPYAFHAKTAEKLITGEGQRGIGDSVWLQNGNAGTSAAFNFLGTTDFEDLVVKTDNIERMRFKAQGQIGIGTVTPATDLEVIGLYF